MVTAAFAAAAALRQAAPTCKHPPKSTSLNPVFDHLDLRVRELVAGPVVVVVTSTAAAAFRKDAPNYAAAQRKYRPRPTSPSPSYFCPRFATLHLLCNSILGVQSQNCKENAQLSVAGNRTHLCKVAAVAAFAMSFVFDYSILVKGMTPINRHVHTPKHMRLPSDCTVTCGCRG